MSVASLSPRERQVLELLAHGRRYKDIAYELGISKSTVATHVRRAMQELDATTPTQAVGILASSGTLDAGWTADRLAAG